MFIRFGFENERCFRDRQEISFVAEKPTGHSKHRLSGPGLPHGLTPVLTLFGANAAGKSNALRALSGLSDLVRYSHARLTDGDRIPRAPFRLAPGSRVAPTRYDCDLLVADEGGAPIRYHFGVVFDDRQILEEWLYAWPSGTRRVLYQRYRAAADPWYFGPSLKGKKRDLADFTRDNSLFLSAAAQNNHPELGRVARAIGRGIVCAQEGDPRTGFRFTEVAPVLSPENRSLVLDFLRAADLGVTGLRQKVADGPPDLAAQAPQDDENVSRVHEPPIYRFDSPGAPASIELEHQGAEAAWFDFADESRGTQRLLMQLSPVITALGSGALLLADELEEALHPRLCARLIGLFESPASNPHGAQLLFTTHHDGLLEDRVRDEVLLVDKGADGAAQLTPLTDFHLRPRDNLRRAYVEGRVGGIPRVGHLDRLLAGRLRAS